MEEAGLTSKGWSAGITQPCLSGVFWDEVKMVQMSMGN